MYIFSHTADRRAQILTLLSQHFGVEVPGQDMWFNLPETK